MMTKDSDYYKELYKKLNQADEYLGYYETDEHVHITADGQLSLSAEAREHHRDQLKPIGIDIDDIKTERQYFLAEKLLNEHDRQLNRTYYANLKVRSPDEYESLTKIMYELLSAVHTCEQSDKLN